MFRTRWRILALAGGAVLALAAPAAVIVGGTGGGDPDGVTWIRSAAVRAGHDDPDGVTWVRFAADRTVR